MGTRPARPERGTKKARADLARLGRYLRAHAERLNGTRISAVEADRALLNWAASAIGSYLAERSADGLSLEQAFGIVDGPGNPGGNSKYLPLAIERLREGLTVEQLMERHRTTISRNERAVRAGLASVNNQAVSIIVSERADAAAATDLAARAAQVERFNRENNIQAGKQNHPTKNEGAANLLNAKALPSLAEIRENWKGPVYSPFDGRILQTPKELRADMLRHSKRGI